MPFHKVIPEPTYSVGFNVAATAALDLLSLVAPAGKLLRLRRIVLTNPGAATAAIIVDLQLGVATAVGSGGAAATPQPTDQGARAGTQLQGGPTLAFAGTARTGDTTQAAGFVATHPALASVSVPAAAGAFSPQVIYEPARDQLVEPLTVSGAATLVLRTPAVGAGATGLRGWAEFTVEDP